MYRKGLVSVIALLFLAGCANYQMVSYEEVETSNHVKVKLQSGHTVEGDVSKTEPHQLTVDTEAARPAYLPKAEIVHITRTPPVKDDFGRGISESDIAKFETSRNSMIYGIGGGVLSLGASFFAGSMIAKDMDDNGGAVLGATTALGGGVGTFLFVKAGQARDRKVAIESVKHERVSEEYKKRGMGDPKASAADQAELEKEKKRQQALRKEREKLLKEINKKK